MNWGYQSPLRYPGSKRKFASIVKRYVEASYSGNKTLIEPYAGGASVSISLLSSGHIRSAELYDLDPLVVAFWKAVRDCPKDLIAIIESCELSIENWVVQKRIAEEYNGEGDDLSAAFSFLFLNRTNFSGIIGAGPIGGMSQSSKYKIGCRFNKDRICKTIETMSKIMQNVIIECRSAQEVFLDRANDDRVFWFIDPPYISMGKRLYRFFYDIEEQEKSAALIGGLSGDWIYTIDDEKFIRENFSIHAIRSVEWEYYLKTRSLKEEYFAVSDSLGYSVQEGFPEAAEFTEDYLRVGNI